MTHYIYRFSVTESKVFLDDWLLLQVKEVFDDVRLRYDIVIDDLQEAIDTESINESPLIDNRYGHPMTWETYHSSNGTYMSQILSLKSQISVIVSYSILNLIARSECRNRHLTPIMSFTVLRAYIVFKILTIPYFGTSKNNYFKVYILKFECITDIVQYMHYLEQTYPNSVEVLSVGTTHENRTLYVVKVSTGEPLPDGEKRQAIWVDGGEKLRKLFNWDFHAMDGDTGDALLYLAMFNETISFILQEFMHVSGYLLLWLVISSKDSWKFLMEMLI